MFWKLLGAVSLFNLLKSNGNKNNNLEYEIEELTEKLGNIEKEQKKSNLKREIRSLKYRISEIDKEIYEGDLSVKDPYFHSLCEEVAPLELRLLDLEFELEKLEDY
jgi:surface protein